MTKSSLYENLQHAKTEENVHQERAQLTATERTVLVNAATVERKTGSASV